MEVVKGTWGFIRRHRRTVTIGVGVAAAGWAVWKAKRFVDDYKRMMRELDEARFDQHRLQLHMLRSRSECVPALLNFLHTVRKRVHELVDVTWAVKKLKRRRNDPTFSKAEQQELWEQIKVAEFARFFLALYGFNLLNVMLRVQVHILGRYAFETSRAKHLAMGGAANAFQDEDAKRDSLGKDDSMKLLSLVYDYFLGTGLKRLAEAVERAVSEELSVWPVHEKARVTYGEVHDMLSRIRRRIEGPRTPATAVGTQPTSFPLLHYVIDLEAPPQALEGKLNDMVNEMWDAVESPSFRFAVEDCIDAAFGVFMEDLHHTMYSTHAQAVAAATAAAKASDKTPPPQLQEEGQDEAQETGQSPTQEDRPEDSGHSAEPPLGKLIPFMKNAATRIFNEDPDTNQYIRVTAENRSVMLLCSSFFAGDQF